MEQVGIEYVYHIDSAIINIAKVEKGLHGLEKSSDKTGKTGEKGMKSIGLGAAAVAKGILIATAAMSILRQGWAALLENMPMMGQTIDMIGKIIGANLLYPLARELMPLIIGLFKWVREHRIQFVEIGTILVSVFRLLKVVIQSAFEMMTSFWNGLTGSLKLGKVTLQDVIDFINLALLKIGLVFVFLQAKSRPLFEFLGSVIGGIYKDIIEPFISGLAAGFNELIIPAIQDLSSAWDELKSAFGPGDLIPEDQRQKLRIFFKYVGAVIIGIVAAYIKLVTWTVKFISWIASAKKGFDDFNASIDRFAGNLSNKVKSAFMSIPALIGGVSASVKNFLGNILNGLIMNLPFSESIRMGLDMVTSRAGAIWNKFVELGKSIYNGFKQAFDAWWRQSAIRAMLESAGIVDAVPVSNGPLINNSVGSSNTSINNNNTQNVKIEINGAQNPQATGSAVRDALHQSNRQNVITGQMGR